MRVLITGASGFIGRNVLLRAPRSWEVYAVYHSTPGLDAFVVRHDLPNVSAVHCDLTDAADVGGLIRRTGPVDVCLHLAANGDPAISAAQPALDLRINTLTLVTLLERLSAGHFVYISSGAVYDRLAGAVTPDTPVAPRLPYAISKLASEHYLRAFAERNRSVGSYVNVRFFGAYGRFEPPRKITTRWMRAAMAGQREFTIRGNGDNLIDLMHVDDAADAFLQLMQASGFSGTVDVASGTPVTVNEIVRTLGHVLGVETAIRHEGHTEEYIQFRSADRTMRDRFGFTPAIPFEEGVRRLHRHLLEEARAGQPA